MCIDWGSVVIESEIWHWFFGNPQIIIVEYFNSSNIFPIAVIQVGLNPQTNCSSTFAACNCYVMNISELRVLLQRAINIASQH